MISRRAFCLASAAILPCSAFAQDRKPAFSRLVDDFSRIERGSGGRLGVAMLDTASGAEASHRVAERFPMCSTFKLLASAAILTRVDSGQEKLDRLIPFGAVNVIANSPATSARVPEGGMSLADLCEAALTLSDNTAANLLLANIGGPQGLTAFARSIGDSVTRLDRIEPDLNEARPGDLRDTTSPAAMLADIKLLVIGDKLSKTSRQQLTDWLLANKTGGPRFRAGLDKTWRVADKTGSGDNDTANDIGLIWPPNRPPIIVCVYLTASTTNSDARNAAIAAVARAVAKAVQV